MKIQDNGNIFACIESNKNFSKKNIVVEFIDTTIISVHYLIITLLSFFS